MELGIQGQIGSVPVQRTGKISARIIKIQQNEAIKEVAKKAAQMQMSPSKPVSKEEIARYIKKILKDSSLLNRDFNYSVNMETNQVIVRVVDRNTNKVVKEIPSESIQRLQDSLRKYIGLLIDKQI